VGFEGGIGVQFEGDKIKTSSIIFGFYLIGLALSAALLECKIPLGIQITIGLAIGVAIGYVGEKLEETR
jgi:hypothetical protein